MTDKKDGRVQTGWRMNQIAYIRDENTTHYGEAVILACLLHSKGRGRQSKDMLDVQRIMHDQNLDPADKLEK
jgi:hypothetical protein